MKQNVNKIPAQCVVASDPWSRTYPPPPLPVDHSLRAKETVGSEATQTHTFGPDKTKIPQVPHATSHEPTAWHGGGVNANVQHVFAAAPSAPIRTAQEGRGTMGQAEATAKIRTRNQIINDVWETQVAKNTSAKPRDDI